MCLTTDGITSPKSTAPESTSRTRSNSRVKFDLDSNVEFPHEQRRAGSRERRSYSDSEETVTSQQRSSNRKPRRRGRRGRDPASQLFNDKYDRAPSGYDSDSTADLPPRFDKDGNRKPESTGNELADRIQHLLAGRGSAGKLFKGLTGELLEGGDGGGDRDSRRGSRRGRRDSE